MSAKISQFEEKVAKLQCFLEIVVEPGKWPLGKVPTLLSVAGEYSAYFQDERIFAKYEVFIRKYVDPPEQAKQMQELMLGMALRKHVSRDVLIAAYQTFVQTVPDGRERAKRVIAEHIRKNANGNVLEAKASDAFLPYVVASEMLDNDDISMKISEVELAKAAIIAVRKAPAMLDTVKEIILRNFACLDLECIVRAALESEEIMKMVLSKLVIMIVKNEGRQFGIEILQKLTAFPKGKPAVIVAKAIQEKHGIQIFLEKD